jgi:hypothetical protein
MASDKCLLSESAHTLFSHSWQKRDYISFLLSIPLEIDNELHRIISISQKIIFCLNVTQN